MLYTILKPIIRLTLFVYFRRFDIIGRENLPPDGPAIYVANHPSAIIDPLAVGVTLRKEAYFLAGANWFGKGFKAYLFKKHFNMIPVYRPWLAKEGEKVSNVDMFKECYKSLELGRSIILFPEATSITVSKIRELKTGAVRIKIGFEDYVNHTQTVPIIPIGLNYTNPHKFQSKVVVKVGEPVEFDDNYEGMNKAEIARAKTDKIHEALKRAIIHVENDENQDLVRQVNRLFVDSFREDANVTHRDTKANFKFAQDVAKAVEYYEANDRNAYDNMSLKVNDYFDKLASTGVSDDLIADSVRSKPSFGKWLLLILGMPIALTSLLIYLLPYQITKLIFQKKFGPMISPVRGEATFDDSFIGSLIFSVGMVIFIIWTLILVIGAGIVTQQWIWSLIALALGYPIFRFSLFYSKIGLRVVHYIREHRLLKKSKARIDQLVMERKSIIDELKEMQQIYANSPE